MRAQVVKHLLGISAWCTFASANNRRVSSIRIKLIGLFKIIAGGNKGIISSNLAAALLDKHLPDNKLYYIVIYLNLLVIFFRLYCYCWMTQNRARVYSKIKKVIKRNFEQRLKN